MKYFTVFFISLLLVVTVFPFSSCSGAEVKSEKKTFVVVIVSIVEIEPIAELRKGFKNIIMKSDFAKTKNIEFREFNAQNDSSITNQIVDKIATEMPDLVYVLGTPIAQAIQKRVPEILLVQGASTDPVQAGLADSWEGSGRNFIATTDLPPIEKQIALIRKLTPNTVKLGVIYNPGEINSVAVISRIKNHINDNSINLNLIERPISNTNQVATAIESLFGNVDAIYLPPDNTAHSAIPLIGKLATEHKIPFFATVESAINNGALATLSLDFEMLGEESAKLALRVLTEGVIPGKLPILPIQNPTVTINGKIAAELKISLIEQHNQKNVKIIE